MSDDWKDISSAPKNEPVLVCPIDCQIVVAIQQEGDIYDKASSKISKGWVWLLYKYGTYARSGMQVYLNPKPLMWRSIPLPPKHIYERKLTADALEKQVKELRGES